MASSPSYTAHEIDVLRGLDPVKQVPSMYTRVDSPAHIIQEVIDNAADEALAGYARNITVTMYQDGSVSVEDDGRGIPVDIHPVEKVPGVQLIFTELHSGGKFRKTQEGAAYSFSGGLHGVGVSVTNALSKRIEVEIWRDGKTYNRVPAVRR
jgi:topoisomerase-4 subunit B